MASNLGSPRISRLISRNGTVNIKPRGISRRKQKFLSDIITTLIDAKWRWNLLLFVSGFVISWVAFAGYYYMLCYMHGDFADEIPDGWQPCIRNVHSFTSAYLFSIETMTTIGYGLRYVTEECAGAGLGVLLQSIVGAALQVALAGLVIAKIKRAKKRSETIMFSKVACILEADLQFKLIFRVGDMRRSHIIDAHARGLLIRKIYSRSGNNIPVEYFPLDFRSENGGRKLYLGWPTTVVHVINGASPFWDLSRDCLRHENFELVVMLEGVVSTTGKAFQATTSYLTWDIVWGHRFETLGRVVDENSSHIVDYRNFHKTNPVRTPWCSARTFHKIITSGRYSPTMIECRSDLRRTSFGGKPRLNNAIRSYTLLGSLPDLSCRQRM